MQITDEMYEKALNGKGRKPLWFKKEKVRRENLTKEEIKNAHSPAIEQNEMETIAPRTDEVEVTIHNNNTTVNKAPEVMPPLEVGQAYFEAPDGKIFVDSKKKRNIYLKEYNMRINQKR